MNGAARRALPGSAVVLALACSAGGGALDGPGEGGSGGTGAQSAGGRGAGASVSGGAGGNGAGGAPATAPTEADACLRYLESWCVRNTRCGGLGALGACLVQVQGNCPDAFFGPGSRRTIDGMIACAAEWESWPCTVDGPPPCAIGGTLTDGAPCIGQAQCVGWCDGGTDSSCGVCAPRTPDGEPCGALCLVGSTCNPSTSICEPLGTPAAEPPLPGVGEACSSVCAGDAACVRDPTDGSARCTAPPPPGTGVAPNMPCTPESRCDAGYLCDCVDEACAETRCLDVQRLGEPCGAPGVVCHAAARCSAGVCVADVVAGAYETVCAGAL